MPPSGLPRSPPMAQNRIGRWILRVIVVAALAGISVLKLLGRF